nr:extracellular solute-binding protein [uncultured Blautia sp.]
MKKKLAAALLTLCMAAGTLAGCGDSASTSVDGETQQPEEKTELSDEAKKAQESVKTNAEELKALGLEVEDTDLTGEFTYWSAFTGDSQVWDQSRVDAFNELYEDKGIKCNVQFVPDGAGINNGKLLSAIAGGQAPDLVICDNAVSAYSYAANGSFEMLEPYLEQVDLNVDSFFNGCKDVIYYKDEPYLIPQDTNVMLLYYNPDIAKEAGLDPENPPKTLDELDQWADAMTIQKDDGTYERFGLIPWLDLKDDAFTLPFFFGADVYDSETNKLNLTSPEVVSCMEWLQSYGQKYDPERIQSFTSGLGGMFSPDHAFMTGKVGMTITGNWFSNALRVYAPDVNYKACAVPVPEGGRANSTTFQTNVFAIPKGSENPELAALFIKFCMSGAVNEDNFAQWRSIPTSDAEFDNVSLTKEGDEMYLMERELANSPENGIPALCSCSAELSKAFVTFREGVIYGNITDIQGELQKLQDKYQAELDKAE